MQTEFQIKGMSCAACAMKVEKAARKVDGVKEAKVNLMLNTCSVSFDDGLTDSAAIIEAIENSGYGAAPKGENTFNVADESALKAKRRDLLLSFSLTFLIMIFSMGPMFGFVIFSSALVSAAVQGVLAFMVCVIQKQYFISALNGLKHLSFNMDTLVSLGSLASFIYSVYSFGTIEPSDTFEVLMSQKPVFFEGAAGILTFVAIGKYIENREKKTTTSAISALHEIAPKVATIKVGDGEREVSLKSLKVGDTVILKQGQRSGVDGVVIRGEGHTDESALTGESRPVKKESGSEVKSATTLMDGYLEIEVTKVGEETTLSKIIKLVENTSQSKVPIARIADVLASYFVPFVIAVSVITFCVWYFYMGVSLDRALSFAISVLVVSCPCALGLATPVAIMAGTGCAAKAGIIFKTPEALEYLGRADEIAFDKTGTLTQGDMAVNEIIALDENYTEAQALNIAASLEAKSSHPIASAFARKFSGTAVEVSVFESIKGFGLQGEIFGSRYYLGNERFADKLKINLTDNIRAAADKIAQSGAIVLALYNESSVIALFGISDTIKDDAEKMVTLFKEQGVASTMLTGDDKEVASAVAAKLGITRFLSRLLPEDKVSEIRKAQSKGHKVVMVGDGINDSASLFQADVGIGLKGASDIAISSCDVVLLKEKIIDVYNAFAVSRATMKNIRQNLFFALVYNVIAIPVACGVLYTGYNIALNPLICSVLMGLSSVCVVTNASRLCFLKLNKGSEIKEVVYMKKTLSIDGMMCNHCTASVKKALESFPGIRDVEVSLENKEASFEASDKISDEVLKKLIDDAGFKVTGIR